MPPLRTTPSDASCGVVTMTPPVQRHGSWHSGKLARRPCPGGKSTQQKNPVRPSPHGQIKNLLDRFGNHRPRPDHRLIVVEQQPRCSSLSRRDCDGGTSRSSRADRRRSQTPSSAEMPRTINVAIQQADARRRAFSTRRRDLADTRGFAHAGPLAAGDGHARASPGPGTRYLVYRNGICSDLHRLPQRQVAALRRERRFNIPADFSKRVHCFPRFDCAMSGFGAVSCIVTLTAPLATVDVSLMRPNETISRE